MKNKKPPSSYLFSSISLHDHAPRDVTVLRKKFKIMALRLAKLARFSIFTWVRFFFHIQLSLHNFSAIESEHCFSAFSILSFSRVFYDSMPKSASIVVQILLSCHSLGSRTAHFSISVNSPCRQTQSKERRKELSILCYFLCFLDVVKDLLEGKSDFIVVCACQKDLLIPITLLVGRAEV